MQTHTTQLRVTLPVELQTHLQAKASKFGLNMSAYVKNLIINDVKDIQYPIYQASSQTESAYQDAKQAEKNGTLVETNNLSDFLEKL